MRRNNGQALSLATDGRGAHREGGQLRGHGSDDRPSDVAAQRKSGSDTLLVTGVPKFQAVTIRKTYDIGWRQLHITPNISFSVASGINRTGSEKAIGYLSAAYVRDPTHPNDMDAPGHKD